MSICHRRRGLKCCAGLSVKERGAVEELSICVAGLLIHSCVMLCFILGWRRRVICHQYVTSDCKALIGNSRA